MPRTNPKPKTTGFSTTDAPPQPPPVDNGTGQDPPTDNGVPLPVAPVRDGTSPPDTSRRRTLRNLNPFSKDAPAWVQDLVANTVFTRTKLLNALVDRRRDIDDECGYPGGSSGDGIGFEQYLRMFEREPVPNRVVSAMPKETWQVRPEVYEDEDPEVTTPFEEDWAGVCDYLGGEESYYSEPAVNPVWDYCERADVLSGIGAYGAILLGIDDGKDLSEPATLDGSERRKILFILPLHQGHCEIAKVDVNIRSPRYGKPTQYLVTLGSPDADTGVLEDSRRVNVHWTRVVHVADGELYHQPRQEPVFNRLHDMRKLYGGSAEMFWKGAFFGLSVETLPELGGDVDVNVSAVRDELEDYMNGLQRYLLLSGMSAKSLAPQVSDPSMHIERQLEAVCVQLDMPKRKFMGTERGELASSQDEADWNDKVRKRQTGYATVRIVVPLVNRLIRLGVLRKPENGFKVNWPDISSQSSIEKADVAMKLTQALATYATSGADLFMTPTDFYVTIMKLSEKDAMRVVENAEDRVEEEGLDEPDVLDPAGQADPVKPTNGRPKPGQPTGRRPDSRGTQDNRSTNPAGR